MKIAFYKAEYGNLVDFGISLASFSPYSHCELVFSDGMCGSASPRDGGVRLKLIEMNSHWDVFEINTEIDEDVIRYWFTINDSEEYDMLGAIGSIAHIDLTSDNKKFCSYIAASVMGLDPIISPGGLFRLLKKKKMINV